MALALAIRPQELRDHDMTEKIINFYIHIQNFILSLLCPHMYVTGPLLCVPLVQLS